MPGDLKVDPKKLEAVADMVFGYKHEGVNAINQACVHAVKYLNGEAESVTPGSINPGMQVNTVNPLPGGNWQEDSKRFSAIKEALSKAENPKGLWGRLQKAFMGKESWQGKVSERFADKLKKNFQTKDVQPAAQRASKKSETSVGVTGRE